MSAYAQYIDSDTLIILTAIKNRPERGLRSSPDLDPDLRWPWKSYRRECLIDLKKYHHLVCGCIVFHCGRADIFTGFIRSSLRRWPNNNRNYSNKTITDSKLHHGVQLTTSRKHMVKHAPPSPAVPESSRRTESARPGWCPSKPASWAISQQQATAAHIRPAATSTGTGEQHNAVPIHPPIGPMAGKHHIIRKTEVHNVLQLHQRRTESATGNMHKKFGKVRPRGFRVMRVDGQTDRHTHTHSLQYFATPTGRSNNSTCNRNVLLVLQVLHWYFDVGVYFAFSFF